MAMNLGKLWEIAKDREAWRFIVRRWAKSQKQVNNDYSSVCEKIVPRI